MFEYRGFLAGSARSATDLQPPLIDSFTLADKTRIKNVETAQRFARAIATDIALYNRNKLAQAGGESAVLRGLLAAEIEEGRALFESRVDASILRLGLFAKAIEEVLVEPHASLEDAFGRAAPEPLPIQENARSRVVHAVVILLVIGVAALAVVWWVWR